MGKRIKCGGAWVRNIKIAGEILEVDAEKEQP